MGEPFTSEWLESHRVAIDGMRDEDVVGIGHVMAELHSLLGRLADPERAAAMGARLPRGMVFTGQPGTGKTLCARWLASRLSALAQAAGHDAVPFYELSSDELSPERMRGLMRYLAEAHPRAVVYLDEIDSWAVARDAETHSPETRLLLTAALAALDGLQPTRGPLVIASSNRPFGSLDPALRRAGRLGFRVLFDLPEEDERVALFELYCRERPLAEAIDWVHLARLTRGRTPAEIVQLVDDAAGHALAGGRDALAQADLLWAVRRGGDVVPDFLADPALLARLCVHEAGHVAVAVALEGPAFVTACRLSATGGGTTVGTDGQNLERIPDRLLRHHLAVAYGGLVAELAVLHDATMGSETDLSTATRLLRRRLSAGLETGLPPVDLDSFSPMSEEVAARASRVIMGRAEEFADLATSAVLPNLEPIRRFAGSLEAARELTGEALQAAIAAAGFVPLSEGDAEPEEGASCRSCGSPASGVGPTSTSTRSTSASARSSAASGAAPPLPGSPGPMSRCRARAR